MRTMKDLVSDILSLSKTDMAMVAEALAQFDLAKAEQLEHLLSVYSREERSLRETSAV